MIVAVTGSVAALKLPELLKLLLPTFNIKLITSDSVSNYQCSLKNSLIWKKSEKWSRKSILNGIATRMNFFNGRLEEIQSYTFNLGNGQTCYL